MSKTEIQIAGFGGQGVILAGGILGRAAAIYDEKYATLTHSYGPEARGGACSAQVIISEERVAYPYVEKPDILVLMSREAGEKYLPNLRKGGMMIYENELVKVPDDYPEEAYGFPGLRMAENMGNRIVLNMVMLGFVCSVCGMITPDAMRKSIRQTVPHGTEDINVMAFDRGYQYGKKEAHEIEVS